MRAVLSLALVTIALAGCGGQSQHTSAGPARTPIPIRPAAGGNPQRLVSVLRVPLVRSRILPGYLLVADRNNDRVLLLSPDKRIVWRRGGLKQPDDAFFTPGYGGIITNEEFDDTLTQISLRTRRVVWRYGHAGIAGSGAGYLHSPDDAYRLPNGVATVADIQNCRILELRPDRTVLRIFGGSCVHDPPRGFASPNGDTPLPDGGVLVTEIGGWVDRLSRSGRLEWSVRTPFPYPSDAQLLPNGDILVCAFTTPGRVVEMTRRGRVLWSFGAATGENRLDRPSLAINLPNGLIAINDDWRHRVVLVDPHRHRIVWQYGHTDVASSAPGYLSKPDGMDFLPASSLRHAAFVVSRPGLHVRARQPRRLLTIRRLGALPTATSRLAAVALPDGRVVALGGLVAGVSSSQILAGQPGRLTRVGSLPSPTHDAAAVLRRDGTVVLFGGGENVSVPNVVAIDPGTGVARRLASLDEPLSDLGAVAVRGRAYLVGGFTGTRYASAILRVGKNDRTSVLARLPSGTRYAGVAALGDAIYVAGGLTESGTSMAVYRVDVNSHRVSRFATLPRPIAHAPLVAAAGALWLVGGDGSRAVYRIAPSSGRIVLAAQLPHALANAAAVRLADRIVVLGGDRSNSVWSLAPKH